MKITPVVKKSLIATLIGGAVLLVATPAFAADESHDAGLLFTKPLVTMYPNVITEVEAKYIFLNEPGAKAHEVELEAAYAVTSNIGIELKVPYIVHDPESSAGDSSHGESLHAGETVESSHELLKAGSSAHSSSTESNLGNVAVALKIQADTFADSNVLFAYGAGLEIPTGDRDKGIGREDIYTIQPFYSIGYQADRVQLITSGKIRAALNSDDHEEVDNDFLFAASILYPASHNLFALLEFDGNVYLEGHEKGDTVVNVSPGARYEVAHGVFLGLGAGVPLTNRKEFDFRLLSSLLVEF